MNLFKMEENCRRNLWFSICLSSDVIIRRDKMLWFKDISTQQFDLRPIPFRDMASNGTGDLWHKLSYARSTRCWSRLVFLTECHNWYLKTMHFYIEHLRRNYKHYIISKSGDRVKFLIQHESNINKIQVIQRI